MIVTGVMVPIMHLCVRIGWVDRPDARKQHEGAIPLAGGLAILVSMTVTSLMFGLPGFSPGLVAAAMLVFVVGFIDDKHPMRARYRFGCHLAAAALIALIDQTQVSYLGNAFSTIPVGLGWLAVPFTIVAITGVINAFNMVDGADGLAGGQGLMALIWLCIAASGVYLIGSSEHAIDQLGPVLVPLAGAVLAFLSFNMRTPWRRKAAVFLGDGGSMLLGLVVAWAAIRLTNYYGVSGVGTVSVVWIIAVPLFDMFSCIARRIADGQTPMSADRKHMHHLLMARGMSPSAAVFTMNLTAFLCGFVGVAGWLAQVPQYVLFWPLIALFAIYAVYARRFWRDFENRPLAPAELRTTSI